MTPTLIISPDQTRNFKNTLSQYAALNRRAWEDIINAKGLDLAHKALANTEAMDRAKVAVELGQIGQRVSVSRKDGTLKGRNRIFKNDSYAARIINSRLIKKGDKPLSGKELEKKVTKFVSAIVRSGGFIRSGWLPAIRKLSALSKDPKIKALARPTDTKQLGQPKGSVVVANPSHFYPTATIINTANKGDVGAYNVGVKGLQKAFNVVIADMQVYIFRKLQEAGRKAKVLK